MASPVRALLMTSNGAGMGHLSRMLAVALAAGDAFDPTMLSLSVAFPVVNREGLVGEYCPSPERHFMPLHRWQGYLRRRLVALARESDAELVAFDGVVPYPGLVAARPDLGDVPMVWIRRGMWRSGGDRGRLARSTMFDLIIEPGDLAAGGDRGPTARRTDAVRVPPITLVDVIDRLDRPTAAAALGISPDRPTALVTLGTGRTGDTATPGAVAVGTLLDDPAWQVCVTRSSVAERTVPVVDSRRVVELRGLYPLTRYLAAFDVAVSSAGYNSVHELIPGRIPTLLVPNVDTRTDDQAARAGWLADAGLALTAASDDPGQVERATRTLTTDTARADVAGAIASLRPAARGGGAARAATLLLESVAAGPAPPTMARRAQGFAVATRERAKQVIGHDAGEWMRTVLNRPRTGGLKEPLPVRIVAEESPAATAGDVRELVLSETIPPEQIASGPVAEHLLPGSSAGYRDERLAIIGDVYRVVPG